MKILLLQFRPNPVIADHEFGLVVQTSGYPVEAFRRVDALTDACDPSLLDDVHAVIIGGSGDYLVSQGHIPEVIARVGALLVEARRRAIPTLGICFGAQILTHTFGGSVTLDASRQETGTFEMTKTEHGHRDPLFEHLPPQFDAQLGHKDHLTVLPPGAVHLASSERSHHQAFTFPDEPVYAVLYHPELDKESMLFRLNYYAEQYGVSPDSMRAAEEQIRPAPHAAQTVALFLKHIVEQGKRHKTGPVGEAVDNLLETSPG